MTRKLKTYNLKYGYNMHLAIWVLGAFVGITPVILMLILLFLLKQMNKKLLADALCVIKYLCILWLIQLACNLSTDVISWIADSVQNEGVYTLVGRVTTWIGLFGTISNYLIGIMMLLKGLRPAIK